MFQFQEFKSWLPGRGAVLGDAMTFEGCAYVKMEGTHGKAGKELFPEAIFVLLSFHKANIAVAVKAP